MGLDSVELLMAFEESFGVNLADGEAAKVVTPGMVIDLICAKLKLTDEKTCQTQRAFYLLRRALVKDFQKQRDEIAPNTPMRLLFPASDCTSWWGDLKKLSMLALGLSSRVQDGWFRAFHGFLCSRLSS